MTRAFRVIDDKTAVIPLTLDYETIIDLELAVYLSRYSWFANKDSNGRVSARTKNRVKRIYMQHLILPQRIGFIVDHINRDSLDNRKENLRYATQSENIINSRRSDTARGITYNKLERKRKAYSVGSGTGKIHLGTFISLEKAEQAVERYRNKISMSDQGE